MLRVRKGQLPKGEVGLGQLFGEATAVLDGLAHVGGPGRMKGSLLHFHVCADLDN